MRRGAGGRMQLLGLSGLEQFLRQLQSLAPCRKLKSRLVTAGTSAEFRVVLTEQHQLVRPRLRQLYASCDPRAAETLKIFGRCVPVSWRVLAAAQWSRPPDFDGQYTAAA